jgi:predicted PurR-regulated permease PerM
MRSEALHWFARGVGLALGALLVFALANGVVQAGRVLFLVFIAVLLASGLEPFVGWLRAHLRLGRGATILLDYAGFFVAVVGIAFVLVPAAVNQLQDLSERLPAFLDRARESVGAIQIRALRTSANALLDALEQAVRPVRPEPGEVVAVGLTVAEAVISVGTVLVIVFFWLTEHARLQRYGLAFVPAERRGGVREAWNEVEGRLGSWVRGQLILMGTMGIATTITYWLLGLDSPILLGLIAAIAEAIPIIGPLLGAIPALLVAATHGPELVAAVALVYLVIQLIEGNVLVPIVMRNTIGISPFLVLMSLLVGAAVGGIPGALVAVPVVAAIEVVMERLQAREEPVAQDPTSVAEPGPGGAQAPARVGGPERPSGAGTLRTAWRSRARAAGVQQDCNRPRGESSVWLACRAVR